jgi:hypothetical protein
MGLPRPRRHSSHSFVVKTDYQLVIYLSPVSLSIPSAVQAALN